MKIRISIKKILLYIALSIAAITFIYPFLWMIGASFRNDAGNWEP